MGTRGHPKELLLKYCLLRAGRWLGAKVKEQKRKIYLKTTQPQTVELRKSLEMVPRCQWEPRNHRALFPGGCIVLRRWGFLTLSGVETWVWALSRPIQSLPPFILAGRAWESTLRQSLHQFSLSLQNWLFSIFFFLVRFCLLWTIFLSLDWIC